MEAIDIITKQFSNWAANPIPSIIAIIIGCAFGFWVSRNRHEGRIDALKERLESKADQIKTKDVGW
jgi:hypothetical protein